MTPARIFISYRRDDAGGDAGRLADHLNERFGADRVFLDIETIEPGSDFVRVLHDSLERTAAMLVVIGPQWVTIRGADGTRRLDDPGDFVRLEVETALRRNMPVVPVLVQGARLPAKDQLPPSLHPLVTRQIFAIDHGEFHADASRLCDRLANAVQPDAPPQAWLRRWWPAAAILAALVVGLATYSLSPGSAPGSEDGRIPVTTSEQDRQTQALRAEAAAQHRRAQYADALTTLAKARELAPASDAVRKMQEDVAMEWIRNVRVENDQSTFGEAIKPALSVIDAALPSADGARRADLLAHSGWATFLLWRDGQRQLDPAEWYRDALQLDASNPYANAMLAHWILFRDDDVDRAVPLFEAALRSGRAVDDVRALQWAGYGNVTTPQAHARLLQVADAMRQQHQPVSMAQAQKLWSQYYFALSANRDTDRQVLLDALPPDDHLATLGWAFDQYSAQDRSRQMIARYYVALLQARAGREDSALDQLRTLDRELAKSPGSLQDAVRAALRRISSETARPQGR